MVRLLLYLALADNATKRERLAILYENYKKKMFFTAYSVLNDTYSAEDAVHEAFIAIAKNIEKIADPESPEACAYVCRAAKTRALNILEAKRRETEFGGPIEEVEGIPFSESEFDKICAESEISVIAAHINRLPDKYRTVIVLRYLDDMKPSKIAELLGINTDTVKKQLLRAKQMLKASLEKELEQ